jgi:vancomycin resistance protein YoaR
MSKIFFFFNYFFRKKRQLIKLAVFGILLICFFLFPVLENQLAKNRISPGIKISTLDLGNKTKEEAQKILEEIFLPFKKGIVVNFNNQTRVVSGFLEINEESLVEKAYLLSHQNNSFKDFLIRLKIRLKGAQIKPEWLIKEEVFIQAIENAFRDLLVSPQNARLAVSFNKNKDFKVEIIPERVGLDFDREKALTDLQIRLEEISPQPIILQGIPIEPEIKTKDLIPLQPILEKILSSPEPKLEFKDYRWLITSETLADWLEVRKNNGTFSLVLNEEKVKAFLEKIAQQIDRLPQNAVFELNKDETRVIKFIPASLGYQVYLNENLEKIKTELLEQLLQGKEFSYKIITGETQPKILTGDSNQLGIKEIVGVGETNFRGSPPNRIKNIKRGVELLNGLLIKPGEEFSLLSKLRPFTEENGYHKELVIKPAEGRTVPEIGGGLCQIATTAFRMALQAGLPITQRVNHFYRVSYYEPPVGVDATIYDPWPDFKFINDTGNYLLLIAYIKDNYRLIFELWGTKDGRKVEMSEPIVWNIVKPPPKKIIETLDLKPGEIKCTEKPHVGSEAKFTYKVIYPDGRIVEKEFLSHYKPWQEVCLLGVEKLSQPVPESPSESSPSGTPKNSSSGDLEKFGTPLVHD